MCVNVHSHVNNCEKLINDDKALATEYLRISYD